MKERLIVVLGFLVSSVASYGQQKAATKSRNEKGGVNEVIVTGQNSVSVKQTGSGNSVQIDHSDSSSATRSSTIIKNGKEKNRISYTQTADSTSTGNNVSVINQSGKGNKVIVKQSGNGNSVSVIQSPARREKDEN
jgi:hypothetical protein